VRAILQEHARPAAVREHPMAGWLAVGTVSVGAFMGQLDASIVTLTFPAVQRQFNAPLAAVEWISLSYLLALVGLVAATGRLADAVGRKLVYLYGFALFSLASAACALAPGLGWLVAFRVVQAVGAAMLQANSVALVVNSMPRERMRDALSVQAAAQALGLALGPTIGGLMVASVGWQWVFWVNVPVGIVAIAAGHWLLPRTRDRTPVGRFDWPGLLLIVGASTTLLLAMSGASGLFADPRQVAGLALAAAAGVVAFLLRESRAASPLIDLRVVRPAAVSVGLVGALCAYMVLFGPLALFPQVMDESGGGLRTGLAISALPAGFALAAVVGSRMMPAGISTRARSAGGALICMAGLAALVPAATSPGWIAALLFVVGVGLGVLVPANNASIMGAVPPRASAVGGGLLNMSRGLGTALGVAVVTLCLHQFSGAGGGWSAAQVALLCMLAVAGGAALASIAAGQASTRVPEPIEL
jgi:EmrB/QacA subfamily drug resistance transporter